MAPWLAASFSLADQLTGRPAGWPGRLAGELAGRLAGPLASRLAGRLAWVAALLACSERNLAKRPIWQSGTTINLAAAYMTLIWTLPQSARHLVTS